MLRSDLAVTNLNIQTIADSVTTMSCAVVDHCQRFENLEEQMRKMNFNNDDSCKTIANHCLFAIKCEERVSAMKAFMSSHFPCVTLCHCSVYYEMNNAKQKREETETGCAQVALRVLRNNVFQEIQEKALKYFVAR